MNFEIDVRGGRLFLGGELPGGSLKVRLMERLLEAGKLGPGSLVADLSAGTGAVALARVAQQRGFRARVYVPDTIAEGALAQMREAGADVRLAPPTPASIETILTELQAGHARRELFWTRQNYADCDAYRDLVPLSVPDHLIAGVGTGCCLRSFGDYFLELNPELKIHAIFSHELGGLRPQGLAFDFGAEQDTGSLAALQRRFGPALIPHTMLLGQLTTALPAGVVGGDSTRAVLQLMQGLPNALGISIDARRS